MTGIPCFGQGRVSFSLCSEVKSLSAAGYGCNPSAKVDYEMGCRLSGWTRRRFGSGSRRHVPGCGKQLGWIKLSGRRDASVFLITQIGGRSEGVTLDEDKGLSGTYHSCSTNPVLRLGGRMSHWADYRVIKKVKSSCFCWCSLGKFRAGWKIKWGRSKVKAILDITREKAKIHGVDSTVGRSKCGWTSLSWPKKEVWKRRLTPPIWYSHTRGGHKATRINATKEVCREAEREKASW